MQPDEITTMLDWICGATVEEKLDKARAIIDRFDVDFDVPTQRHLAIGVLEALGATAAVPESERGDLALAVHVGAAWCRILHADVEYRQLVGLELIGASKDAAKKLTERVANPLAPSDEAEFSAYVAARWHDAAGRIQFRCGDMMSAREYFETAQNIARAKGLWYCLGDIGSNYQRARFDEHEKAGITQDLEALKDAFKTLLVETEAIADEWGVRGSVDAAGATGQRDQPVESEFHWPPERTLLPLDTLPALDARHQREFLRGLSNIYHNLAIVLKPDNKRNWPGDRALSLNLSKQSAAIAFALGDGYRMAQALRHRASLETANTAKTLLGIVRKDLPWERGSWMATQQLATLLNDTTGAQMLRDLLDDLDRRAQRGGELGFDVDVFRFTVDAFAKIVGSTDEFHQKNLEAVRSVRRMVKVSTYRQRYAEQIFPFYLDYIRRTYDDHKNASSAEAGTSSAIESWERLTSLVEEASAREVLDLLEDARAVSAGKTPGASDGTSEPLVGAQQLLADIGKLPRGESVHERFRNEAELRNSPLARAMNEARKEFEEAALHRPLAAAPHDAEIAPAMRRLTAGQRGLTIVRYLPLGYDKETRGPAAIGATVIRDGVVVADGRGRTVVELDISALRALATEWSRESPREGYAKRLWASAIEPLWDAACLGGLPGHLVLVPTVGMFGLPLHAALVPHARVPAPDRKTLKTKADLPLGAVLPLSFSVSATAFVSRRRYLLRHQSFDAGDDLCALVPGDANIDPRELVGVDWDREHFHLAGRWPKDHKDYPVEFTACGDGDKAGFRRLLDRRAEVFVFAGHGASMSNAGSIDVAMKLAGDEYLTQYEFATQYRLRRNKWTLLGACVSGQGGDTGSGEVAGFIRAFMAAGAGALGVTQWSVRNDHIAHASGSLLQLAAKATKARPGVKSPVVDIVGALMRIQRAAFLKVLGQQDAPGGGARNLGSPNASPAPTMLDAALAACPLALYL